MRIPSRLLIDSIQKLIRKLPGNCFPCLRLVNESLRNDIFNLSDPPVRNSDWVTWN